MLAVCVNHFPPLVGGCEKVTSKIADHLSQSEEVTVFTRQCRLRKHSSFPYRIHEYVPGDAKTFLSQIRSSKPDKILIYSDVFDYFRTVVTSSDRTPLFIALCGANWIYEHSNFANLLYRQENIKKIICHSKHDRDFKLCSSKKLLHKTIVIPNGVDLDEFDNNNIQREELVHRYKLPDCAGKRWVLNVSNFFPGKGQEHIFDVLKHVDGDYVYIQIASDIDFPIGRQLESRWVMKSSKHGKSFLLKNIPRSDVVAFLKQSNVFAFSSEKEVAPIVVLESMAARLPWVSMDVGNVRGLRGGRMINAIKNSKYYSQFDGRVVTLFAKAITEVWNNPAIGDDGRLQIEREMTWKKILPEYSSVLS